MSRTQRQQWMRTLALSPLENLEEVCADLPGQVGFDYLRRPESGSIMLRGRTCGDGAMFNMGEATLTRCSVVTENGSVGTAYVLGRSHRKAVLAALCDALLQEDGHHQRIMETVIQPLENAYRKRKQNEAARTAATKVDFFTMVRGE